MLSAVSLSLAIAKRARGKPLLQMPLHPSSTEAVRLRRIVGTAAVAGVLGAALLKRLLGE